MMTSGPERRTAAVRGLAIAVRMLGAITGGAIAGMFTIALVVLLPVAVFPVVLVRVPLPGVIAMIAAGHGLAFFVAGAAARRMAGVPPLQGWIGVGSALAFVILWALLPDWRWRYEPQSGWVFLRPEAAIAGHHTVMVCDFTVLLWLSAAAVGGTAAWLGDSWMTRRLNARSKEIGPAAAHGGEPRSVGP